MTDSTQTQSSTNDKYIDYLTEDDPVPNQKFCCVSFLSPESIKNCSMRALKIRGVFDSKEEADDRAKFLQKVDPDYDVFVGEVGKWLPFAPEPNSKEAGDIVYAEQKLNELAKGHVENLKHKKIVEAERKREMLEKNNFKEVSQTQERLRKKLEERNKNAVQTDIEQEIKQDEQNQTNDMNARLNEIKELYSKIKQ